MSNFTPEQIANIIPNKMAGGWRYRNDSEINFFMWAEDIIESAKRGWFTDEVDIDLLTKGLKADEPIYGYVFRVCLNENKEVVWRLARHIDHGLYEPSDEVVVEKLSSTNLLDMIQFSRDFAWC